MSKTTGSTHGAIAMAKTGAFVTLSKVQGGGALQARRQSNGAVTFYWRYTFGGKTERVIIGLYDPSLPPKKVDPVEHRYSIAAAAAGAQLKAREHAALKHNDGYTGLTAWRQRERDLRSQEETAERARQEQDAEQAKKARAAAMRFTLEALLNQYCDYLQALGRTAYRDAKSIFKLHAIEAWATVAGQPACDVSPEQIADMIRKLHTSGKPRTANKLRSYMRAAYEVARSASTHPEVPGRFKEFNVTTNPVAGISAVRSGNQADKDPLSREELRAYWALIKDHGGIEGAVLRLHLLTGGQRIEQLVNLKTADTNSSSITIHDGKGRPGKEARPHLVPLTTQAAAALKTLSPAGEFALSTDGGETHIAATTLSKWAVTIVGEVIPRFRTKRIRSGVETLLSSAGVSQEIRGRLQSHGISGVQNTHYDAYDYLPEKRRALELLFRQLSKRARTNS